MNARVLPPEEWHRLEPSGMPLIPGLRPADVVVVVVEDGDRVVACMTVLRATHFEGLWIDPMARNLGTARTLLREAVTAAKRWTDDWVFAASADDNMRDILERIGAVRLPMDPYVLSLETGPCPQQ